MIIKASTCMYTDIYTVQLLVSAWICAFFGVYQLHIHPYFSSNPGRSVLKELKSRGRELQLEVLTTREDWIEIITSINMTDASHLSDCTTIASFPEIIVRELEENWATLKHHISPQAPDWISKLSSTRHSLKRSVNTRDCREGACEENVLGDKWFTEFVRLSAIRAKYEFQVLYSCFSSSCIILVQARLDGICVCVCVWGGGGGGSCIFNAVVALKTFTLQKLLFFSIVHGRVVPCRNKANILWCIRLHALLHPPTAQPITDLFLVH